MPDPAVAPLPETRVCNPYHHHVAMTMFGLEVLAMTFNGESEQAIHSPHRPQVAERTTFPARGAGASPTVLGEGRGIRFGSSTATMTSRSPWLG